MHAKYKHIQVKKKIKWNDLASEWIPSSIMCTRRKSAQSAEIATVCVKYKHIFDKILSLDDLFYLDKGTKVHVTVKKDSDFMKHSGDIHKAYGGDFSEYNPQLMIHSNEIF